MSRSFGRPPMDRPANSKTYRTRRDEETSLQEVSSFSLNVDTGGRVTAQQTIPMPQAPQTEPDLNLPTRVNPIMEGLPGQDLEAYPPTALGNPDMTDQSLEDLDPDVNHDHQYLRQGVQPAAVSAEDLTEEEDMVAAALAARVVQPMFGNDWRKAKAALMELKGTSMTDWPHWAIAALAWVSAEEVQQAEGADVNQHPVPPRDEKNKNHGDGRDAPGGGGAAPTSMPGPVPVPTPLVEQDDKEKNSTMSTCSCCGKVHGQAQSAASETPHVVTPTQPNGMDPIAGDPPPDVHFPLPEAIKTAPTLNDGIPAGGPHAPAHPLAPAIKTAPTLNDGPESFASQASADLGTDIPVGPQTEEMRRRNPQMPMQQTDVSAVDMEMEEDDAALCGDMEATVKAALASTPGMEHLYTGVQKSQDDGHLDDIVHKGQVGSLYFQRYVASGNIQELHRQAAAFKEQRSGMANLKNCASHTPDQRSYGRKVFAYSARQMKSSLQRTVRKLRDPQNANPDEKTYVALQAMQADLMGPETAAFLTAAASSNGVVHAAQQGDATERGGSNMEWTAQHREAVREGVRITSALVEQGNVAADLDTITDTVMSFAQMDESARAQMAKILSKKTATAASAPATPAPAVNTSTTHATRADAEVAFANLTRDEVREVAASAPIGRNQESLDLFGRFNQSANRRHNHSNG